ncbi:hypothetical protein GCM10008985_16310 [Halococcus dombrowskii]|uniref:Uncharacterized protein n=1 Tax=Halococcus dombrowskii TaxID=179637 RepID=A0AAV3SFC5_HALDO
MARVVTAVGVLYLDYVGTGVSEQLGRERAWEQPREIQYSQPIDAHTAVIDARYNKAAVGRLVPE